jgi:hypothetical protein
MKGKRKPTSKGKMKGKFGKPMPSRVNYNMDYFVDIEKYQETDDDGQVKFNVMSLQQDNATFAMNALKAIIDTGATESVCGVTSMARMLDSYEIPTYHVSYMIGPCFGLETAKRNKPRLAWTLRRRP